ncbi:MAG: histidine--tRNA ligase [Eubacterium sp.]|nr:histidine--tRNA ligase [Eubacterium sp.]
MISSNPVRGARDILPGEMLIRDTLEQKILSIYRQHGFSRIETPALENIDLLLGSEGGENLKMLFTILKRGDKLKISEDSTTKDLCDMGLRFDLTLPLSRFYANNAQTLELPFKAIQIGNVFRAERPQKGRFRSFKQCDIDIIGDPTVSAEMELISTTAKALLAIGFEDFTIKVNDRKLLNAFIKKAGFAEADIPSICISLDKADKIGPEGVAKELVDKGYDEAMVAAFVREAEDISLDNIGDKVDEPEAVADLKRVIETSQTLAEGRYKVVFDFSLIRGMGYYTGQIFEVSYGPYGFSIAGGGRYDNMIGKYAKTSVPAVGFSIGFERIVTILMEEQAGKKASSESIVLFYDAAGDDMAQVIRFADTLRDQGKTVNLTAMKKKFGKQIGYYADKDYDGFMVFGRDEAIKSFD